MQPMDPEFAERRLADAEERLTRALQHLHALRRAALAGGYDPLEFDRALVAYRRAEHEAMSAREALAGAAVPAAGLRRGDGGSWRVSRSGRRPACASCAGWCRPGASPSGR